MIARCEDRAMKVYPDPSGFNFQDYADERAFMEEGRFVFNAKHVSLAHVMPFDVTMGRSPVHFVNASASPLRIGCTVYGDFPNEADIEFQKGDMFKTNGGSPSFVLRGVNSAKPDLEIQNQDFISYCTACKDPNFKLDAKWVEQFENTIVKPMDSMFCKVLYTPEETKAKLVAHYKEVNKNGVESMTADRRERLRDLSCDTNFRNLVFDCMAQLSSGFSAWGKHHELGKIAATVNDAKIKSTTHVAPGSTGILIPS